jgi:signal transduction histidine kinase
MREQEIYLNHLRRNREQADGLFIWLLATQWIVSIIIAIFLTPYSFHPHVITTVFLGGCLSLFPIYQLFRYPGRVVNGYIVTIAQMAYSIILIHITGGRIETHFHIFGSLAFLSFYREPRLIILATVITTIDHLGRGAFFPMSIYGANSASIWRAFEHIGWIVFEDVFLFIAILGKKATTRELAKKEYALELAVIKSEKTIFEQQQNLIHAEQLSAIGEMAAGIAHEVNNPLAIIASTTAMLRIKNERKELDYATLLESLNNIENTVLRASNIVVGLRNISRTTNEEERSLTFMDDILNDVLAICQERLKNYSVDLIIEDSPITKMKVNCNRVQISQVLLNLFNNALDAIKETQDKKWIRMNFLLEEKYYVILLSDSGPGISEDLRLKIFQPFFTTKEVGKGTGLGLSVSNLIMEKHGGTIDLVPNVSHTQFRLRLPR